MRPTPFARVIVPSLFAAALGCSVGWCVGCEAVRSPGSYGTPLPTLDPGNPFAPVAIRVHPLTQIDTAGPRPLVVLHVELRDRWGDSVKGVGTLRVQLLRPGSPPGGPTLPSGPNASIETQDTTWDVPQLADPEENSKRYDPVTRTYRIALGAPAWLAAWASGNRPADAPAWVKLRATLDLGEGRFVSDELVLR